MGIVNLSHRRFLKFNKDFRDYKKGFIVVSSDSHSIYLYINKVWQSHSVRQLVDCGVLEMLPKTYKDNLMDLW